MLFYPLMFGDPSQLPLTSTSPPPLGESPNELQARVTATPARASYHRISQRAHNTVSLSLSYAAILLFWVFKTALYSFQFDIFSRVFAPAPLRLCLFSGGSHVFVDSLKIKSDYLRMYVQLSTFTGDKQMWKMWAYERVVMKLLICILQLSLWHLPILLQNVAGTFCAYFFFKETFFSLFFARWWLNISGLLSHGCAKQWCSFE